MIEQGKAADCAGGARVPWRTLPEHYRYLTSLSGGAWSELVHRFHEPVNLSLHLNDLIGFSPSQLTPHIKPLNSGACFPICKNYSKIFGRKD